MRTQLIASLMTSLDFCYGSVECETCQLIQRTLEELASDLPKGRQLAYVEGIGVCSMPDCYEADEVRPCDVKHDTCIRLEIHG